MLCRTVRHFTALYLILVFGCPLLASNTKKPATNVKITNISAKVFNSFNGTLSEDVLADPDINLFNRVEIDATLVLVEVSPESEDEDMVGKIEFTAIYRPDRQASPDEITVKKVAEIFDNRPKDRKYYVGFWLDRTGCWPVKLSVRIIGKPNSSPMKRVIDFACGE
jgi:hypothetical protein